MRKLFLIPLVPIATIGSYCGIISIRPESEKLHVVMDLDNTILQTVPIKGFKNINHSNAGKYHNLILSDGNEESDKGYFVWHRPFAHWSLWFLNKLFVVHVFTAATRDYGESALEAFPGLFVNKRYYRDSVTQKNSHGKDLTLITSDKVVLVDDQLRNRTGEQEFYHIPPFSRFCRFDFELPKLCLWSVYWVFQHDIQAYKK